MSWTLIESQTLASSAASVTLGSGGTIPQTYKSLKLVMATSDTIGNATTQIRPNGSTTNLSSRILNGDGTSAGSVTQTTVVMTLSNFPTATANTFAPTEVTFPNYSGATAKPMSIDSVTENNATMSLLWLVAGLWNSSAAITSLQIVPNGGGNFITGCTFYLYGLK